MKHTNITRYIASVLLLMASLLVFAKMRIHQNVDFNDFPLRLRNNIEHQNNWQEGFLDVTKAPYNAKADGFTDDTEAIQNAIYDAFASNLVAYFPSGTYLVSKQLRCIQPEGNQLPINAISSKGQRKFGHILLGCDSNWPTLKLADNARVNENILLFFAYINQNGVNEPSRHYLASIRNFKIDMGNNPEVSAISNAGAQYSVIQNISVTGNFDAGIQQLPGSGGYSANITISGGKVGIRQNEFRPCPTVFGLKLEGQSQYGIELLNARGGLTVAGFKISSPENPSSEYRSIFVKNSKNTAEQGAVGDLVLCDGSISSQSSSAAILNYRQNIVMKNVWCKASQIFATEEAPSKQNLLGNKDAWRFISEYVFASTEDIGTVSSNGKLHSHTGAPIILHSPLKDSIPPNNLVSKHLWSKMPTWEDEHINIVRDFGVTPNDNSDDDAVKFQMAIDSVCTPESSQYGKTLFIPRGYFHLKSTLIFRDGLKMVGAGKNIAVIAADKNWLPQTGTPVVVANNGDKGIKISDFALFMWSASIQKGAQARKYFTLLHVNASKFEMRDVQTDTEAPDWLYNSYRMPMLRFSENAGGKIYGLCADLGTKGAVDDGFSLVFIENTQNPLTFYQTSIEDVSEPTTPEEEAENLLQLKVINAQNVSIYGFKFEGCTQHSLFRNCDTINIYGGAGNYWMEDERRDAIFEFENTKNIFIANLSHDPKVQLPNKAFIKDDAILLSQKHPCILYKKTEASTETSMLDKQSKQKIELFPNPVNEFLYLKLPNMQKNYGYTVFNIQGQSIQTAELAEDKINCSELVAGTYLLSLQNKNAHFTETFVKQ